MYWWIAWDLVVGSEVWMHLRMNGILPFLALLFLLNHQQAACCSLLKDRPKSCVLALNGAGVLDWDRRGVYLPSSYPDCASTVHKLTFSPVSSEATAQVFSLHPLAEGSRKASTPAMQSGTCLSCMWAHKQKMSMRLLCTPGFVKSRQTFLEEEISAVLFPEISQLGVARVSESSLPLSTHTKNCKMDGEDGWTRRESEGIDKHQKDLKGLKGNSPLNVSTSSLLIPSFFFFLIFKGGFVLQILMEQK